MKKLLSLMSVVVLSFALTACSGSDADGEMMDDDTNMDEMSGDMMEIDHTVDVEFEEMPGYAVTLNYVMDNWMYPDTAPANANNVREGAKMLALNLTVENTSDEAVTVKARDYSVWDETTNYAHWIAFAGQTGFDEFEQEVTVQPGEEYTGTVLFTVDENVSPEELEFDVYKSNVGRSDDVNVVLGDVM